MKREIVREIRPDFLRAVRHRLSSVMGQLDEVLLDMERPATSDFGNVLFMPCSKSGLAGLRSVERMVVQARRAYNEGQMPLFGTTLKDVCDLEERG